MLKLILGWVIPNAVGAAHGYRHVYLYLGFSGRQSHHISQSYNWCRDGGWFGRSMAAKPTVEDAEELGQNVNTLGAAHRNPFGRV